MFRHTFRHMVQILGALVAGLAIILSLFAWRLSSGPISLGFLSPTFESVLSANSQNVKIRLQDTILTWAGWDRTLDIRVLNVRAINTDGTVLTTIPELSLSLSARAMMRGRIAPKRIELFHPKIRLLRKADGQIQFGFGETKSLGLDKVLQFLIVEMLKDPDPGDRLSYLNQVSVFDADLTLMDETLGLAWHAPSSQLSLIQNQNGLEAEAVFGLDVGKQRAEFLVLGRYQSSRRKLDVSIRFSKVVPALFSHLEDKLTFLADIKIPIEGSVDIGLSVEGAVDRVGFNITGGSGTVALPHPIKQTVKLQKLALRGRYDGASQEVAIRHFAVDLGANGAIVLPAPSNHIMPLQGMQGRGLLQLASKRLSLEELKIDFHGPTATVAGVVDGSGDTMTIDTKSVVTNIPIDDLRRYWPRVWGTVPYDWVTEHLSDGVISEMGVEAVLRTAGQDRFDVEKLAGTMALKGVTVDYLPPMPKVRSVDADAVFDMKRFKFTLLHGEALDLKIKKGTAHLTGLDQKDQYADIDIKIEGPVESALKLVEGKPIEFASNLGFTSSKTRGHSSTRLQLNFILERALTFQQVKVSAVSNLTDVSAPNIFLSQEITDGLFQLKLDQTGLNATGTATVGEVPATISLRRNFKKTPYLLRYNVRSRIDDAERFLREKFGLTFDESDYIRGPVLADFTMDEFGDNRAKASLKLDVETATVSLLSFGWVKGPSVKGTIEADMTLENQAVKAIPNFRIDVADLKAAGSAEFAGDGKTVRHVKIDDAVFGRSKMSGQVKMTPAGWSVIELKGPTLDLSEVWNRPSREERRDPNAERKDTPKFHVVLNFDKMWLHKDRPISNVTGSLSRRGDIWESAFFQGRVSEKGSVDLALYGTDRQKRSLSLLSNDAGAMLRALGYYDNMLGGNFKITGTYDDTQKASPLTGRLTINGYRIIKAPVLARVVSIMALTGIFESLQGEGLSFSLMDVPFEERNGTITFKDARASGPSLGFTAGGSIYTHAEVLNIEGTVVPAYLINSFFGQIPLLGDILTGGEKGGGIFAANFKMTGSIENPKVSVNPLSALAPGIFRNLFNIFRRGTDEPALGATAPREPARPDGS